MPDLKVTTGTINYTDFLHVTAAKVSAPGTPVWETWIPVPITNYNFIIPGLDPENYIISFYDAPTNVALGSLRLQLIANALTNEFIYEKRYYKTDRGGVGIGYSMHSGIVIVADGTEAAGKRISRVLNSDPGMGVVRHADAGYETSIEIGKTAFRERGGSIPMLK
jgi:hypothetical protein